MDLNKRRGVVTGAGSGIGRVLAVQLGRRGADLLLVGRRSGPLEETAVMVKAAGGQARVLPLDITADGAPQQVIKAALEHGALELLVNNAGNISAGQLEDLPEDDVQAMIDLNLTAPILLTRLALPHLRQASQDRGALVLNVSSAVALIGLPFYSVYAATKSGIARFGESLRRELHETAIHVATVYPGATDTDMLTTSNAGEELGFGRRPVEEVVTEILTALDNGEHEINTAIAIRRKMQELNARDPLAVDADLAPRLPAMKEAVRSHRRI